MNVLELDRANRGDVDVPLICRWTLIMMVMMMMTINGDDDDDDDDDW